MTLKQRLLDLATKPATATTTVPAPELGKDAVVHFRRLSLGEAMAIIEASKNTKKSVYERAVTILSLALAEPDGSRSFPMTDETQASDRLAILAMPERLVDRLMHKDLPALVNPGQYSAENVAAGKASSETTPK